jgi:hypothetical protein
LTRSTRVTWQSGKKRGLHQGQIESLASLVINLVQEADSLSTADERASPIVAVELGAGKALLGRVVADLLGDAAAVVAVERRAVPIINFDAKAIGKSKAMVTTKSTMEETLTTTLAATLTTRLKIKSRREKRRVVGGQPTPLGRGATSESR